MSSSFSGEARRCYICGELLKTDDRAFMLQGAKIKYGEDPIYVWKSGGSNFISHAGCQQEILWKQFNNNLTLEKEYYPFIRLSWKDNKRRWRLGNKYLKENCSQEELDNLVAVLAKDLLNDKITGF